LADYSIMYYFSCFILSLISFILNVVSVPTIILMKFASFWICRIWVFSSRNSRNISKF